MQAVSPRVTKLFTSTRLRSRSLIFRSPSCDVPAFSAGGRRGRHLREVRAGQMHPGVHAAKNFFKNWANFCFPFPKNCSMITP